MEWDEERHVGLFRSFNGAVHGISTPWSSLGKSPVDWGTVCVGVSRLG